MQVHIPEAEIENVKSFQHPLLSVYEGSHSFRSYTFGTSSCLYTDAWYIVHSILFDLVLRSKEIAVCTAMFDSDRDLTCGTRGIL